MSIDQSRISKGVREGGQFAASAHHESPVALHRGDYNAEDVVRGILEDARQVPVRRMGEFYWDNVKALQDGETTYENIMTELAEANHGGRCYSHRNKPAQESPERHCHDCHLSYMVEARTNSKPPPRPVGNPPEEPRSLSLEEGKMLDYSSGESSSRETIEMTGDEKFHAAVRNLFSAADDAAVAVKMETYEDWSSYTGEYSKTITVTCGSEEREYEDLGDLMRDLSRVDRPDVMTMASRFMQATDAPRPLLHGMAAVYLDRGDYSAPEPVFGKIFNVYAHGSQPMIAFMHRNGRKEYIKTARIATILETDQSGEYDEDL